jgi:hypothetical protein
MTQHTINRSVLGTLGCAVSFSAIAISTQANASQFPTVEPEKPQSRFAYLAFENVVFDDVAALDEKPVAVAPPASDGLSEQLAALAAELKAQRELIAAQNDIIARQQAAIDQLTEQRMADNNLGMVRGTGWALADPQAAEQGAGQARPLPNHPVGEAPPEEPIVAAEIDALPTGQGVLTPKGTTVLESSFDYTRTSKNRLVFRGFELIPGLQVGLIEASDADRDTMVGTVSLRHGITDRLEIEARMPVLARHDRIQVVQQRDEGIVRQITLNDYYVGDAEVALRYQLNDASGPDRPIYVANLRVKSNTGRGPFDIGYDDFGVATGLATGSGFWGVQGGISFLIPSDPVVLYGGTSYLYHIPATINKTIGGALVGRVDPGDAISANVGFGFALNSRFSFSLGYNHSYIFPTKTEIGGTNQKSTALQVGSFGIGASFRTSDRTSVNLSFEFGMTSDAPDVSMTLRLPLRF